MEMDTNGANTHAYAWRRDSYESQSAPKVLVASNGNGGIASIEGPFDAHDVPVQYIFRHGNEIFPKPPIRVTHRGLSEPRIGTGIIIRKVQKQFCIIRVAVIGRNGYVFHLLLTSVFA